MQGNGPLRLPGAGDTQTPAFKGSAWAIYMSRPIKCHVDWLGLSRLMHNQPAAETQRNSHTTSGGPSQHQVDQEQRIRVSAEHAMRSRAWTEARLNPLYGVAGLQGASCAGPES